MKLIAIQFVFAICVAATAAAGEIVVRPQAVPKSAVVRLGDLAEIRGIESGAASRLAALPLLPAPAAGTQRFLRLRELQDMVAAHGEDVTQLRFTGATQIAVQPLSDAVDTVESAGSPGNRLRNAATGTDAARGHLANRRDALTNGHTANVDAAKNQLTTQYDEPVRKAIVEHLAARAGNPEGWRATINLSDRQRASLASSTSPLACEGGVAPWTGKQRFVILFSTADGPMQMPLLADVMLSQPVVMAVRPIAHGAVITAADVEVQQSDSAPGASGRRAPLHSVDELVGMEAGRAIQTGEIIFTDLVVSPLLIRRNEAITVVAQGGGIRVHTTARARQDGARGDLIQVESLDTKERFDARVTGLREASVLAPVSGPAQVTSATAGAAGRGDASPDASIFRRYQRPQPAPPRTDAGGNSTAFRKLINQNGKENVQSR